MNEAEGYETTSISIRRVIGDDDQVFTEWTEDAPLIELLGLVEYARDTILRAYMGDVPEDDDA